MTRAFWLDVLLATTLILHGFGAAVISGVLAPQSYL
jgi:hypothetical protein